VELLRRRAGRTTQSPSVETVLGIEDVRDLRDVPEDVRVEEDVMQYVSTVSRTTREDPRVEVGVSPRGTQRLFEAARSRAAVRGREYVTPEDVKRMAEPALAHRLVLTPDAAVQDVSKRDVVGDVLGNVAVPTVD